MGRCTSESPAGARAEMEETVPLTLACFAVESLEQYR